jgi:hypothetical protein
MIKLKDGTIRFNTDMVKALRAGKKSETRRCSAIPLNALEIKPWVVDGRQQQRGSGAPLWAALENDGNWHEYGCVYGPVGKKFWVKEEYHIWGAPGQNILQYKADCENPQDYKWDNPRFMRREYSRETIEVTGLRLERVRNIDKAGAIAEGIESKLFPGHVVPVYKLYGAVNAWAYDPVESYMSLWDVINGKKENCSWQDNPYVWVIQFRRVEK